MKITQVIPLLLTPTQSIGTSWAYYYFRFAFNPAHYSNITKIYFRCNWWTNEIGWDGEVGIYDEATSTLIASDNVESLDPTHETEIDVTDLLTSAKTIQFACKGGAFMQGVVVEINNPRLVIEQEFVDVPRKTEAIQRILENWADIGPATWTNIADNIIHPQLDEVDGTKEVHLQAYMSTWQAAAVYIRLFDMTSNLAVDGSELWTDSYEYVSVLSGPLVINTNHDYCIQVKTSDGPKNCNIFDASLRIFQSGFTTCFAIPLVHFAIKQYEVLTEYRYPVPVVYPSSHIEATTIILRSCVNAWIMPYPGYFGFASYLYNITDSQIIGSTIHTESDTGNQRYIYRDSITLDAQDDTYGITLDSDAAQTHVTGYIYGLFTEALPVDASIHPDISQPSGYHCFMSQFLRNIIAGYDPFLTPDAINRCGIT